MRAEEILKSGLKLLESKGQDYCEDKETDQHQNFDRSNLIASWFKQDVDKSFAVLIGTKLARLASLLNSNKVPNNESILDSFIDGANYFALWGSKRMRPTIEELDKILNQAGQITDGSEKKYSKAQEEIILRSNVLTDKELPELIYHLKEMYDNRMMTNRVANLESVYGNSGKVRNT